NNIQTKVTGLKKANKIVGVDKQVLEKYGIHESATAIEAANQLAGVASLQITGSCVAGGGNAKLLLTHIPVFTPEGLASYFEHLAALEGKPKTAFSETNGIYDIEEQSAKVSKEDITARLQEIINAVMIADEAHHKEFAFLYDISNPIYKRINEVTLRYLGQPFNKVLPHRIGMSGTPNSTSAKAFPGKTLYNLTIQKMITQGLVKQVSLDTATVSDVAGDLDSSALKKVYAQQIVVDYFLQNTTLSIKNILGAGACAVDLFSLSKGLLFAKNPDKELDAHLMYYFNLLPQVDLEGEEAALQKQLFKRINEARVIRAEELQAKLKGEVALSQVELEQVVFYNKNNTANPIRINEMKLIGLPGKVIAVAKLTSKSIRDCQRTSFKNNVFALYLEFVLSKSTAPKEMSDIIGLQNALHDRGFNLIDITDKVPDHIESQNILSLMRQVDPKTITKHAVDTFLNERLKDDGMGASNTQLREQLKTSFLECENNCGKFLETLNKDFNAVPLPKLMTDNRSEFEAGTTMVMLGSRNERTGYSHEPVGIVVDISADPENCLKINRFLDSKESADVSGIFEELQTLASHAFTYDEKNQAGGRALRTPYGHVKY
ncbi:MAG: hypothetical protein ACHP6H_06135, partial [Legionellales bacterium]